MKKFFHIARSFEEAENFYAEMDLKKTPQERLADMEFLHKQYFLMKNIKEKNQRLVKVIKIIKPKK